MFSLIRPAKVEGHGVSAGHIHHSQGGKLLQLLREEAEFQKSPRSTGSSHPARPGGRGKVEAHKGSFGEGGVGPVRVRVEKTGQQAHGPVCKTQKAYVSQSELDQTGQSVENQQKRKFCSRSHHLEAVATETAAFKKVPGCHFKAIKPDMRP